MQEINWDSFREAALFIHHWAERTFPGRTPETALLKVVVEEIPELLNYKKERGVSGIGPELADVFVLLLDLSIIWGVDLPTALRDKMQINERRMWQKDEATGFYHHGVNQQECSCWKDMAGNRIPTPGCPQHGNQAIVESEGGEA